MSLSKHYRALEKLSQSFGKVTVMILEKDNGHFIS